MEEDSREEHTARIRRTLTEWFGPFDEFHDRVAKNQTTARHGLIRSKMKPRPTPNVALQLPTPQDSPSHIPVHVALQSMRNLVDEPLSALPQEFSGFKKAKMTSTTSSVAIASTSSGPAPPTVAPRPTSSESSVKKRKIEENGDSAAIEAKRKKGESRNSIPPSTPDSGVHSTESDLHEDHSSEEITTILNIMKTLDEPQLSPIPDTLLEDLRKEKSAKEEKEKEKERLAQEKKEKEKAREIQKQRELKETKVFSDSSISAASTSREPSEEPEIPKIVVQEVPKEKPKTPIGSMLKLKALKPEKFEKLVNLAKSKGKVIKEREKSIEKEKKRKSERPEKPERSEKTPKVEKKPEKPKQPAPEDSKPSTSSLPPPPRPPSIPPYIPKAPTPSEAARSASPMQKPANKTVQNLQNSRHLSPSTGPSPRSSVRSTTPSMTSSRPSSSLSMHENPIAHANLATTTIMESGPLTPSQFVATPTKVTPTKPARWACQWDHTKLKTIQRVPIPDPTTSKQTKGELYRFLAKDYKAQADQSKDRVMRPLHYMLASIYFVLEAIWKNEKDRTPQGRMQCSSIYRDSYELLGISLSQGIRDTDDVLAAHILPRVKVLGQMMLSVMQYQMYLYRADSALKTMQRLELREVAESIETRPISRASDASSVHSQNHHLNVSSRGGPPPIPSAGSTPSGPAAQVTPWVASIQSCTNTVTMPSVVYESYKTQIKTANALILASRYWEDSKLLARQVDASFIKDIEGVLGKSVGMDMPFDVLAQFVLTAVGSLRAEYEEELRQPLKPVLAKMKKSMDCAIRIGTFIPDRPPPQHRQSTSQQAPPPHNGPSSSSSESRPVPRK